MAVTIAEYKHWHENEVIWCSCNERSNSAIFSQILTDSNGKDKADALEHRHGGHGHHNKGYVTRQRLAKAAASFTNTEFILSRELMTGGQLDAGIERTPIDATVSKSI